MSLKCDACKKRFTLEAHHSQHVNSCPKMQKKNEKAWKLAKSLGNRLATPVLKSKKRRRVDPEVTSSQQSGRSHDIPRASGSDRLGREGASGMGRESVELQAEGQFLPSSTSAPFDSDTDMNIAIGPSSFDDSIIGHSDLNSNLNPPLPPEPEMGKRKSKPSARLLSAVQDILPAGPGALIVSDTSHLLATVETSDGAPEIPQSTETVSSSVTRRVILHVSEHWKTLTSRFNTWRDYRRKPTNVPDINVSLAELSAVSNSEQSQVPKKHRKLSDVVFPYPNVSSFLFAHQYKSGSDKKTKGERKGMQTLLGDPRFRQDDVVGVNFDKMDELIAQDVQSPWGGNGWKTSGVRIHVPTGIKSTKAMKQQYQKAKRTARENDEVDLELDETPALLFDIKGIRHRSLTHVLQSTIQEDAAARKFHWHAFEEYWQPPYSDNPERIYGELYSSTAFCEAERDLLASPTEEGCELPRVIAAYMLWSDATHVTQFGQSKLWPVYLFFGNQTKYDRVKPSARSAHHVAFIPSLPDDFTDFLKENKINPTPTLLTHCRRELFHGVWELLLDEEFMRAYKHGVVIKCADGITRRVYPRIFTYSADYPEKVLIATIRDMGGCPCPRCKMPLDKVRGMGTTADRQERENAVRLDNEDFRNAVAAARNLIYKDGYVVTSKVVDDILKGESLVPTENTFSTRLSQPFGSSLFEMLVVDYMHEFELGVWKAVLTHLIRILDALGRDKVTEFNKRFREVPTFGRDTIRRFSHNVSELKKLGARDFEDILICSIPCFEGLLPEPFGGYVADLLYVMNLWAGLAKLRMHTDSTLDALNTTTTALGNVLRHFSDVTSPAFETFETDSEYQKRKRNEARKRTKASIAPSKGGKRRRTFNLATSKLHALGDYPHTIRKFGTVESYSTQAGELQHRVVKKQYARTNKNKVVGQMVKMDVMETVHRRMYTELEEYYAAKKVASELGASDGSDSEDDDKLPVLSEELQVHYRAAKDQSKKFYLNELEDNNFGDPAFKDFVFRLRKHILLRIKHNLLPGEEVDFEPTSSELREIEIEHNRIYEHATAALNYTTYDVRREQDTINPETGRRFIVVNANEDEPSHPFWYARVLGVFHANVFCTSHHSNLVRPKPERIDFLWVRWFGNEVDWSGGSKSLRLDRIGYVPEDDQTGAFGFVDPTHVLRGCHLIPAFALGRTTSLLSYSKYRDSPNGDWTNYYVNRFVDRDMLMHYLGLGIGHLKPRDFPRDDVSNNLKPEVLIENDKIPWVNLDDILTEEGQQMAYALNEEDLRELEEEDESSNSSSEPLAQL